MGPVVPVVTSAPTSTDMFVTTTMLTASTTPIASCVEPWEHCAEPSWAKPKCCTTGYECKYSDQHWARCQPAISTSSIKGAGTTLSTTTSVSATMTTMTTTTTTKEMMNTCAAPWEHCAEPSWVRPKCCTAGHECKYSDQHWARCQPTRSTSRITSGVPAKTTTTTTTTKEMANTCVAPWEHCAEPGWLAPKCCTSGYKCVFANGDWARCQPLGRLTRSFLAAHHAMVQKYISSSDGNIESRPSRPDLNSEL